MVFSAAISMGNRNILLECAVNVIILYTLFCLNDFVIYLNIKEL